MEQNKVNKSFAEQIAERNRVDRLYAEQKDSFYLFNNQFLHSLINFEKFRYIFSIEFLEPKENLLYPEIHEWCRRAGLLVSNRSH